MEKAMCKIKYGNLIQNENKYGTGFFVEFDEDLKLCATAVAIKDNNGEIIVFVTCDNISSNTGKYANSPFAIFSLCTFCPSFNACA